jgi:adenosylcobinamide-GDP ribazoletransferase
MTPQDRIWRLLADLKVTALFYTRLPLPQAGAVGGVEIARASWAGPIIGLAIGLVGAFAYWLSMRLNLPPLPAAALAVAATIAATGALHEDGLADVADSLGGATRERKLEIMRDSRIGAFGTLALILSVILRVTAIADLPNSATVACALLAAHAGARALLPALMWFVPPARADGLSAEAGVPPIEFVLAAFLIGLVVLVLALGFTTGLLALLLVLVAVAAFAWFSMARFGGQTGDVLGAAEQVGEVLVLLVAAARM